MKKKTLYIKILVFSICVFFISMVVGAVSYLYTANNVSYSNSNLSGSNVQAAVDNLYNKCLSSTTSCPNGMTCTKKNNIKCKRATTLHTEICQQTITTNGNTCSGAGYTLDGTYGTRTIKYGNQTATEGVLATGDAFDCDVNGDGTFNPATERFYYVSDYFDTSTKNFNDSIAVLIYYSNTKNGVASNSTSYYASFSDIQAAGGQCSDSRGCSYYGPLTVKKDLPTTSQWSNISLFKSSRELLNEGSKMYVSGVLQTVNISYAGYSARLITLQELVRGCNNFLYHYSPPYANDHDFDYYCSFLYENTEYSSANIPTNGIWLETIGDDWRVFAVDSYYHRCAEDSFNYASSVGDKFGARPVIEIPKSQMSY